MRTRTLGALAPLACLCFAAHAAAINIVPVFNSTDNETPAFDIFNQGLQDLFTYAEGYYEDILEGGGYTLTINFWYEDLEDSVIGLYNPVTKIGDRVTEANIRIDTREDLGGVFRDWYIDSTPATDGEFEMEKILWDDPGVQQFDYVTSGSIPDALEVGYRGSAINFGVAFGKYDMLSTVLHEIGHALGINSGATHENADDDYDFNPVFVFGADIAAEIDTDSGGPDPGHVKPGTMLMCGGCASASLRRRPSHADFFAMATSSSLTQIDVPRREFLGGGIFNFAGNWSGNRTPDTNDEAFIRSAGLVTMNASDTVAGLNVIDSTTLAIGSNSLNVNGTLTLNSRFSNVSAKLVVGSTSQLIANELRIVQNGELDMAGGVASVLGDLDMATTPPSTKGAITGYGNLTVIGQFTGVGDIRAEGGVLTVTAGSFDLDGDINEFAQTVIEANLGNVILDGPHVDTFKDNVEIGFGRLVTFQNAWTLDALGDVMITDGGLINNADWQADGTVVIDHTVPFGVVGIGGTGSMNQGPTGSITTSGIADFLGPVSIGGAVHVLTEAARFSAGGTFTDTAGVMLDAGTTMNLIFANTYTIENDASFTGPGTLVIAELSTVQLESGLVLNAPMLLNGRMEIGASPGEAAASAGYTQAATGVAEFEIGGYLQGRDFDFLDVTGSTANLAGTLELSLINGFVPQPGDSFTILTADNIVGSFPTILGTNLGGGLMFEVIVGANDVTVYATGLPIPGDLDGDGFVGINDLNIVLGNWNQTVPPANPLADPSGDNFVGIEDLNTVLGNWNKGIPPGAAATVPEPATAALCMLGLLPSLSRRR